MSDFAGAGAGDGDVVEELSSCVFRKRWCIGEELLQSHARIEAMLSASPPPPLPMQFSRHSTLQAQRASLHQTPDRAARCATRQATDSHTEKEGAQSSERGREGLRHDVADETQDLVQCLVLCRVILPGARAELPLIIDEYGQVTISEPSNILPEFFIFYTLIPRSDSDDPEAEAQQFASAAEGAVAEAATDAADQMRGGRGCHASSLPLPVEEHRRRVVLAPGGLRKPRPASVVT